ncbi:hypothetical protein OBBRIDRAFT_839725 [Obba rivulosa]|uniref:Uncharacterized protein n=1 Tax=Obba rivulosa TaxID=1052685 RepID=A0A8E2AH80_9APHY|nr:hypothetical protein OBBRIDRAFT_839725 [Obba rivulosa]
MDEEIAGLHPVSFWADDDDMPDLQSVSDSESEQEEEEVSPSPQNTYSSSVGIPEFDPYDLGDPDPNLNNAIFEVMAMSVNNYRAASSLEDDDTSSDRNDQLDRPVNVYGQSIYMDDEDIENDVPGHINGMAQNSEAHDHAPNFGPTVLVSRPLSKGNNTTGEIMEEVDTVSIPQGVTQVNVPPFMSDPEYLVIPPLSNNSIARLGDLYIQ